MEVLHELLLNPDNPLGGSPSPRVCWRHNGLGRAVRGNALGRTGAPPDIGAATGEPHPGEAGPRGKVVDAGYRENKG